MKKYFIYTILIAFIATISFTGCKETLDDVVVDEYALLTEHMKSTSLDLDKVVAGFVTFPAAEADVASKYIIDLRSAADFANGRIATAVNVPDFKNLLTEAAKATKPILVVCYSGQTATYAVSLLRMYGYIDAVGLKWGMSGWNATYDKWTANCKDLKTDANWNTEIVASTTFAAPKINTGAATGAEILKKRVEAVVAAGFRNVSPADVLATPTNYFINNYFSEAHYTGFGHIKGAYRVQPLLLADGSISKLDPSKKVVTYCYTGQTSGSVSAWLNVLGYDAYSMLWGMNGISHSNPFWTTPAAISNRWGFDSKSKSYSTVK